MFWLWVLFDWHALSHSLWEFVFVLIHQQTQLFSVCLFQTARLISHKSPCQSTVSDKDSTQHAVACGHYMYLPGHLFSYSFANCSSIHKEQLRTISPGNQYKEKISKKHNSPLSEFRCQRTKVLLIISKGRDEQSAAISIVPKAGKLVIVPLCISANL